MGTSGFILRKKEDADFEKLIDDIKTSADEAGLIPRIESECYNSMEEGLCIEGNVANTYEEIPGAQQWMMYIFSDGNDMCDWLIKDAHVFSAVIFDRIGGCEEILLDFLYEYLKRNPEDYFWAERDWYYTYEDIVRFKQEEFDPDWCHKNPHLDTEDI